jgi:carbon-monoxide dehydrogenase medium subunit
LQANEVIVAIRFPAWRPRRGWGFAEVSRRLGDFAIAGVTSWIELDDRGNVAAARIVLFAVEDRPLLLLQVADSLVGQLLTPERLVAAGRLAASMVKPRSDLHASAEYRSELVEVLVERVLAQAAKGARKDAND